LRGVQPVDLLHHADFLLVRPLVLRQDVDDGLLRAERREVDRRFGERALRRRRFGLRSGRGRRRRGRGLRADAEALAQLAQAALLVLVELRVLLQRFQERGAAQEAYLIDDDQLGQLLAEERRDAFHRFVRRGRVLQRGLADLALLARGQHPAQQRGRRVAVLADGQHLLHRHGHQRGRGGLADDGVRIAEEHVQELGEIGWLQR
jgi:hypothetical protein